MGFGAGAVAAGIDQNAAVIAAERRNVAEAPPGVRTASETVMQYQRRPVTVDQIEGKSAWDTLTKGKAWVQFCLFDDTTPKGDGQTTFGEPVSSMVWAQVH